MSAFLFYFFSLLTVVAALFVVINRDAVNCALCMVVALAGVGAMFFLLEAPFLGVLQIIVYAGAVMVLFLFIIMLLDETARHRLRISEINLVFVCATLVAMAGAALWLAHQYPSVAQLPKVEPMPTDQNPMAYASASKAFGFGLFTRYLLPFEVAGFLLLIAMVGVIVLSKRPEQIEANPAEPPRR
ncbi:MAG TPA: NADH-quinone oxidoreductase subunit J [Opitutales bacterium]|nr:NADH-quinone oxidoreductase subunit J [Opitutales bacterium]